MRELRRISAWGLLVGWLLIAYGGRTVRGDGAGLWILVDPLLATGIGVPLISSTGLFLGTATGRATAANR
jgi:hypothetical protein